MARQIGLLNSNYLPHYSFYNYFKIKSNRKKWPKCRGREVRGAINTLYFKNANGVFVILKKCQWYFWYFRSLYSARSNCRYV